MKNLLYIFIICLSVSCSNDDDDVVTEPTIFGKWFHKDFIINDESIPYDDHESCGKDYIEFYDTNKIKSIDIWDCEEDLNWIGTFLKEGNQLTVYNGDESITTQILELTDTDFSYSYTMDIDGDGTPETIIERYDR